MYILIPLVLVITLLIVIKIVKKRNAYKNVRSILLQIAGFENVKLSNNKAFDYEMNYNDKIYLVKLIYNPKEYEINVNSKNYWQINKGIVSSRKTGEKLEGVYDLINFNVKENCYEGKVVKLYVIYPNSKSLLKVINECEMEFIKPKTDIYGCKITTYYNIKKEIDEL